jgi:NADH dehydrogenase/NADH:ubiquinone oxidoreductase subunit G
LARPFAPGAGQPVLLDLGDEYPSLSLLTAVQDAPFQVVVASYHSPLTTLADVVLPVENGYELTGHYQNLEGRWQMAHSAMAAPREVRSNVEVLAGLAERLGLTIDLTWTPNQEFQLAALAGSH